MSFPAMLTHLLCEQFVAQPLPRVPEPALVMEADAQVQAFADSGRDDGLLRYLYLYHAIQALPLIRPGDLVLDLACGPANQLQQIAQLAPEAHFIGLDASPSMLAQAEQNQVTHATPNLQLQTGDMTRLSAVADASLDVVLCTMSLHHLPDLRALTATMKEIQRVLKKDGGVYLADFGQLKRRATQRFFAHDRADLQSAAFTQDFLASLHAAFSVQDWQQALTHLPRPWRHYRTAAAPFMQIVRSPLRQPLNGTRQQRIVRSWQALPAAMQRDFHNLARWFALGGLPVACRLG